MADKFESTSGRGYTPSNDQIVSSAANNGSGGLTGPADMMDLESSGQNPFHGDDFDGMMRELGDDSGGTMQEFAGPGEMTPEIRAVEGPNMSQVSLTPWTEEETNSFLVWCGVDKDVVVPGLEDETPTKSEDLLQHDIEQTTALPSEDLGTKRTFEAGDSRESLEDSEQSAKRRRLTNSDERSDQALPATFKFRTVSGKTSFSDLTSRLLARDENRRHGRKLRARDETGLTDKAALTKIFKNKPIARGCWACVQLDGEDSISQCSLLNDHGQWPCHACSADKVRCELITQPIRKTRCIDCKRRSLKCSYTYTRNHEPDCEQCSVDGHRCLADPAKDGGIVPRIGMIRAELDVEAAEGENVSVRYVSTLPPAPKRGKAKVAEDCRECVHGGESCRYPTNFGNGPCESCKIGNLPCTMPNAPTPKLSSVSRAKHQPIPQPETSSQPKQSRAPPSASKPALQTPLLTRRDSGVHGIGNRNAPSSITRWMRTSFRHPMVFNSRDADCTFCTEPELQIVGFGVAWTDVVDCGDLSGFVEIEGGHAEEGFPVTKLCGKCTTTRLSILTCRLHDMQPMADAEYSDKVQAAAKSRLLEDDVGDIERHCHVCFNLATYSCCAAESEDEGDDDNCGLQLCELCTNMLVGGNDGNLNGLIADIVEGGHNCRADAELLTTDGPLERYITWQG